MKWLCALTLFATTLVPAAAGAQTTTPAPDPASAPDEQSDPDARVDALQPDFNLAALPTTLRMPVRKFAFRVTHRFNRPLGDGDFGDLASDLFGFDAGAQIGLEVRYGLARGTQIGVHRTSNRAIQLFGQHSLLSEKSGKPIGLDAMATFEGTENLRSWHRSALGLVASRNVHRFAALYAEPFFLVNSNPGANQGSDNNTLMLGLGARLRIRPSTYLVGEITPRLAGFEPGVNQISFGLEGRAGGHLFQLNFSNGFGTTLGQIADGGFNNDNWYLGFNIARKFF
ncbi:MAG TPA: DUF5777 family beta-barrel protein [Gemmatimonadaceae bacterium]|nr:DUF5777 family beta-barrel protein [Gemmatimonadaceae bacterium]